MEAEDSSVDADLKGISKNEATNEFYFFPINDGKVVLPLWNNGDFDNIYTGSGTIFKVPNSRSKRNENLIRCFET